MSARWPALAYSDWQPTCDTLHAHTQVLGKLAAHLAPAEPQLQHAALRLTARGWETAPLPAPDGSGSLVIALDLRRHEAVVEHSGGQAERIPLTPDRAVGDVTTDVLAAVRRAGGPVQINPAPQEVPWSVPLDTDDEHARYDRGQVVSYFAAATRAALILAAFKGALPGPVDAGQCLVGLVRPGGEPVLWPVGRACVGGLHHAQRHGRARDRGRMVAW